MINRTVWGSPDVIKKFKKSEKIFVRLIVEILRLLVILKKFLNDEKHTLWKTDNI